MNRETAKRLITYYYYMAGVSWEKFEEFTPILPENNEFFLGESCGYASAAEYLEKYLRGTWAK